MSRGRAPGDSANSSLERGGAYDDGTGGITGMAGQSLNYGTNPNNFSMEGTNPANMSMVAEGAKLGAIRNPRMKGGNPLGGTGVIDQIGAHGRMHSLNSTGGGDGAGAGAPPYS